MPFAVAISTERPWRGRVERASNTFTYGPETVDAAGATDAIQRLVQILKGIYADDVQFVEGRAWSIGGTPEENETLAITDLSGFGERARSFGMSAEAAVLVSSRSDRNSTTGRPVYFRKWFHSNWVGDAGTFSQAINAGTEQIPETIREVYEDAYAEMVNLVTTGATYTMQTPAGASPTGPIVAFPWQEHRQFPRGS